MLVLFYYRELMWSIGNIPDFEQDERGHDLEVVRPLNEIESAPRVKLAVASRWVNRSINPSNTLAQHLL
jgi:hypothetical protein